MLAVYDLAVSPPTFDFVAFLVSAERERVKRGEKDLRIVIAPGPNNGFRRDRLPPQDPAERRRMLDNIVIPMCSLLPHCAVAEGTPEKADFPQGWSPTVRTPHYGMDKIVSSFKADCYPLTAGRVEKNEKLVTLTLRDTYHDARNSNKEAWSALAAKLEKLGLEVMVITNGMLHNAAERARVYAGAGLNLFVNNGPAWMASLMRDVPCLIFKMVSKAICCDPSFFAAVGLPVGSQIGRPNHRIVWHDDDEETLINETMIELAHGL